MEDIKFKYKVRQVTGYNKISERGDVRRLENCKMGGFKIISSSSKFVYFSITNQLYRLLKLSQLDDQTTNYKIKFLNFMIERSKILDADEDENYDYGVYWYSNCNEYYSYDNDEIKTKKIEYKDRIRNQNRHYKMKTKR